MKTVLRQRRLQEPIQGIDIPLVGVLALAHGHRWIIAAQPGHLICVHTRRQTHKA